MVSSEPGGDAVTAWGALGFLMWCMVAVIVILAGLAALSGILL